MVNGLVLHTEIMASVIMCVKRLKSVFFFVFLWLCRCLCKLKYVCILCLDNIQPTNEWVLKL